MKLNLFVFSVKKPKRKRLVKNTIALGDKWMSPQCKKRKPNKFVNRKLILGNLT